MNFRLNGDKDVIATVESRTTCGSTGCIASIFLTDDSGELTPIPFSYALTEIEILDSVTQGMHDLRINGMYRIKWFGTEHHMNLIESNLFYK